jgi:hypothetical protein
VPRYFPILTIANDGTVKIDPRAERPAGGVGFGKSLPENPPPFVDYDGGSWDGSGFRSSGLPPDSENDSQVVGFSLRITKAGRYQYACLIHPKMVGTVVVS